MYNSTTAITRYSFLQIIGRLISDFYKVACICRYLFSKDGEGFFAILGIVLGLLVLTPFILLKILLDSLVDGYYMLIASLSELGIRVGSCHLKPQKTNNMFMLWFAALFSITFTPCYILACLLIIPPLLACILKNRNLLRRSAIILSYLISGVLAFVACLVFYIPRKIIETLCAWYKDLTDKFDQFAAIYCAATLCRQNNKEAPRFLAPQFIKSVSKYTYSVLTMGHYFIKIDNEHPQLLPVVEHYLKKATEANTLKDAHKTDLLASILPLFAKNQLTFMSNLLEEKFCKNISDVLLQYLYGQKLFLEAKKVKNNPFFEKIDGFQQTSSYGTFKYFQRSLLCFNFLVEYSGCQTYTCRGYSYQKALKLVVDYYENYEHKFKRHQCLKRLKQQQQKMDDRIDFHNGEDSVYGMSFLANRLKKKFFLVENRYIKIIVYSFKMCFGCQPPLPEDDDETKFLPAECSWGWEGAISYSQCAKNFLDNQIVRGNIKMGEMEEKENLTQLENLKTNFFNSMA